MSTPPRWNAIQWPSVFSNGRKISADDVNTASGSTQFFLGGGPNAAQNAPRFEISGTYPGDLTQGVGVTDAPLTQGLSSITVYTDTAGGWNSSMGVYTIPAGCGGMWFFSLSMAAPPASSSSGNDYGLGSIGIRGVANLNTAYPTVSNPFDRAYQTNYVSQNPDIGASVSVVGRVAAAAQILGWYDLYGTQYTTWPPGGWAVQFSGIWLSA